MALNEPANPKVASLASQGLFDPASLTLDDVGRSAPELWRASLTIAKPRSCTRPAYEQIDIALALARYRDLPDEAA